jgi:hypothetical protein
MENSRKSHEGPTENWMYFPQLQSINQRNELKKNVLFQVWTNMQMGWRRAAGASTNAQ